MLEKTNEDLVTIASTSTTLSQDTAHNVTVLSEKLSQAELEKNQVER